MKDEISKKKMKIVLLLILSMFLSSFVLCNDASAGSNSGPWTFRGSFVYISTDSDWDPIDELFGFSADLLRDVSPNFSIGAEINYATGDEDLFGINVDATWAQVLALGEYNFITNQQSNLSPYVGLGVGLVNAELEALGISEDDTSFGLKPYLGLDYFFSGSWGFNLQIGYLWSESTLSGIDFDTTGFEGKIGITFTF